MQDYHVYAHYIEGENIPQTSPKRKLAVSERFTVPNTGTRGLKGRRSIGNFPIKTGTVIALTTKVNRYVGELSENRIAQRKAQLGITATAIGLLALKNPPAALAVAGYYLGDKAISYGITIKKENISAEYLRDLSGGTYKSR